MLEQGDIYITKLERGFFGAFRIIKKGDIEGLRSETYLISVTSYIETEKPKISDPRLLIPLVRTRYKANDSFAIDLYTISKKVTKSLEYLGNLPMTLEESKMVFDVGNGVDGGYPLCGPLKEDIGFEAFRAWRWEHEPEEYINENNLKRMLAEEKQAKEQAKRRAIVVFMNDSTFWGLISLLDWNKKSDSQIIKPVIEALAEMSGDEIVSFEETLSYKLYQLDTKEHARNSGEYTYDKETGYVSSDSFLYARAVVIANGELFYKKVLKNPSAFPQTVDFEPLLYIASKAYRKKTKKEFDHITAYSYESFSNEEGWK